MTAAALPVLLFFVAHLLGDYVIQTDWMAQEKVRRWWPAVVHGVTYAACYLLVTRSIWALLVIGGTHIVIDRYRLAKHLSWAKNQIAPRRYRYSWAAGKQNGGYGPNTPIWMATWLMILCDNAVHLVINALAVVYL